LIKEDLVFRFDRTLGGLDLQVKLRDFLADEFNALKKTKTDVRTVPRAMAKLFNEAGKVKNVLSANAAIYAQVYGRQCLTLLGFVSFGLYS
jgi:hypoxia up-regulated 1